MLFVWLVLTPLAFLLFAVPFSKAMSWNWFDFELVKQERPTEEF